MIHTHTNTHTHTHARHAQVRSSLSALARNSTGFSLRQPHLDRTRLCELADADLDPGYVQQRERLKATVQVRPGAGAG